MSNRPKIRVFIAELDPLVEASLRGRLGGYPDIELSPPRDPDGDSQRSAIAYMTEWCPDVVVVPAASESPAAAYHAKLYGQDAVRVVEIRGDFNDVYEVRLLVTNPGDKAAADAIRNVAGRSVSKGNTP